MSLSSDAVLLLFCLCNRDCDEKGCFSIRPAAVINCLPILSAQRHTLNGSPLLSHSPPSLAFVTTYAPFP